MCGCKGERSMRNDLITALKYTSGDFMVDQMLLSFFAVKFLLKFQQGWHKFVEPLPPKKWKTAQP